MRKPEEYEKIVCEIVQSIFQIAQGNNLLDVKQGTSNLWEGDSGYRHQIDVSASNPDNLLLVECKCWNKRIPVETVLAFYGRLADISPRSKVQVHGIIATTAGFQKGAEAVARHFGVDLCLVKSAHEFGMRYKDQFAIGVHDSARATESVTVEIVGSPE